MAGTAAPDDLTIAGQAPDDDQTTKPSPTDMGSDLAGTVSQFQPEQSRGGISMVSAGAHGDANLIAGQPIGGHANVGGLEAVSDPPLAGDIALPNASPAGCGLDVQVYDLNAEGERQGDRFELRGTTSNVDRFSGRCRDVERMGSEALIRFRAPVAGRWSIRSVGTADGFDTIVYARSQCIDESTEVDCNDDIAAGEILESRIDIELEVDQEVFIIVDHFEGLRVDRFTLRVEPIRANPTPTFTGGTYIVNSERRTVALALHGSDAGRDISAARLRIRNDQGMPVGNLGDAGLFVTFDRIGFQISSRLETANSDDITGWIIISPGYDLDLDDFIHFDAQLVDSDGQSSPWRRLELGAQEVVGDDDFCNDVSRLCRTGRLCIPDENGHFRCQAADAAPSCPDTWTVSPLRPAPDGSISVEGTNVDSTVNWRGRCGGGGGPTVYSYTAPNAGTFLFRADGLADGTDPVLYLRNHCQYAVGLDGADIACNLDRDANDTGATVAATLYAGERIFIYVDSSMEGVDANRDGIIETYRRTGQGPYRLTVVPASPPTLIMADASFNRLSSGLALQLQWRDSESDAVQAGLAFIDADGQELPLLADATGTMRTTGYLALPDIEEVANGFSTNLLIDLNDQFELALDLDLVAGLKVHMRDISALTSESFLVNFAAPPIVGDDNPCDPLHVQNRCRHDGQACIAQDGRNGEPQCVPASAPTIESAILVQDWRGGEQVIGVRARGRDDERNTLGLIMDLYDDEMGFLRSISFPFPNRTMGPGDAFIGSGTFVVGDRLPRHFDTLQASLYDTTSRISESIEIELGRPAELNLDERCLTTSIMGRCTWPALCLPDGVINTCQSTDVGCPDEWRVTSLTRADADATRHWSGIAQVQDVPIDSPGLCGGQPSVNIGIFELTVPEDGLITCDARVADGLRPVIYARSHCGVSEHISELICRSTRLNTGRPDARPKNSVFRPFESANLHFRG